jgi:hypothetical protein
VDRRRGCGGRPGHQNAYCKAQDHSAPAHEIRDSSEYRFPYYT